MSGRRHGASPSEEHRVFDELAVGWALHALEPEDEAVFAEHLPGCARCAQTVADTTEVMAAMAADLPRAEPSDRLRDRLRAAVAETEQVPPGDVPAEPVRPAADRLSPDTGPSRRRPPRCRSAAGRPVLALAAAAVAAIARPGRLERLPRRLPQRPRGHGGRSRSGSSTRCSTPGEATVAALSADDGTVVATVVARADRVEVVSHGLAPNDTEDQTYVVWGIDDDRSESHRRLRRERSQMTLQTVGSGSTGLDEYDQYAISLEPGREAPSEPTEIVASRVGGPAERTGDRGASGPPRPRRETRDERRARYDSDEMRSLRERVAETRWRRRLAARRSLNHSYRICVGVVGGLIVALGLVTIPLPGPGWLTVIAGLFVLATEFTWAERLLEFTKKHVKRWTDWVSRQPVWVRVLIAAATAAFVYGVLVVTLHMTGVPDWVPGWVPLWR